MTQDCRLHGCRDRSRARDPSGDVQRIESASEADDVERARVEVNRRAREEAGAARQPRAGGPEDLLVGETTTGDDEDVNVGGAAGNPAPLIPEVDESMPEPSPGGAAGSTAPSTRGAGDPAPRDEPEAKRRREASNIVIQEITDELRTFEAVVGPKFTRCAPQEAEGIEINQLDLKDAVVSEIFCKNRFASNAPSFGLHPGFAIDHTTEWDFGEPAQEADVQAQRDRAT